MTSFFEICSSPLCIVVAVWFPRCFENNFTTSKVVFSNPVAFEFIQREVHAISFDVFSDIAQNICELHEDTPGLSKFPCPWVIITIDFNAHQSDDGGNPVTVNIQLLKRTVSIAVEIVFHS